LVGLLGASFGLLIRHTAGAVSSILGAIFVLPVIVQAFPVHWQDAVGRFLPETIGEQSATPHPLDHHFHTWGGIGLMLGYVAVLTAIGVWLLQRRDA
jgi:hypothetical protein